MTLISLLLVLALERVVNKTRWWQKDTYQNQYFGFLKERRLLAADTAVVNMLGLVLAPAALLYLLLWQMDAPFLELIINTAILMVCVGCADVRSKYKGYLEASSRGDEEAAFLYAQQLGYDPESDGSFGRFLVWVNYRHYGALMLWFLVLGGAGAVFYQLSVGLLQRLKESQSDQAGDWYKLVEILDWLPARITALGLLLVGHFSRALPVWMSLSADGDVSARQLITQVAKSAEHVEADTPVCTEEACTMVIMAKRNMMLLLAAIAVFTLSGWVG
ncbi:beta-lactamase regulator AmpE [Aliiglaciecola sp. CAU 1673]|uniref:beta-lactamase regulator AmpE n=1 Tax=Aliiglaciecola sp. CAU 1673 TaxID=3032595 RepID=UPI0023D9C3E9|nr:beta-lactamase regulator AmpE [Aliiglaciecola sp. CAU 1673]MDF2178413.1 beta-lactamase regulator AmpE [Aliiglaciecola sp. CAU 1673]